MKLLSLKIVSPEKLVFEDNEFESITLPTEAGEITVLPGHIPLVAAIAPGEIVARKKGKEMSLITTKGFLKLDDEGNIFILSDYAVRSEDIEIAKVEEARKKAERDMKDRKSEKDFVIAEAELKKTLLELKVIQRRRSKSKIPQT
jgi:F-type H+-transporting ATPase subunit epsilon